MKLKAYMLAVTSNQPPIRRNIRYGGLLVISILFLVLSIKLLVFSSTVSAAETLYFIHSDHLGSTNIITDETGEVVSQQVYYPYGTTRATEGLDVTEREYTGQVSDIPETGLYYYNARYYNPTIAKFTQADSQGDTQNKYSYVANNPIIFIDPTGNYLKEGAGNVAETEIPLLGGIGGDITIPPPTGITGGQTLTTWTGPIENYPHGGEPNPEGFFKFIGGVLGGSISAPVITAMCAGNPICIVEAYDLLFDSIGCVGGDEASCANISNPIPGASLTDDVAEAVKPATRLSPDEAWLDFFHFMKHADDAGTNIYDINRFKDQMADIVNNADMILHRPDGNKQEIYIFIKEIEGQKWSTFLAPGGEPITSFNLGLSSSNGIYNINRANRYIDNALISSEGARSVTWSQVPASIKDYWINSPSINQIINSTIDYLRSLRSH